MSRERSFVWKQDLLIHVTFLPTHIHSFQTNFFFSKQTSSFLSLKSTPLCSPSPQLFLCVTVHQLSNSYYLSLKSQNSKTRIERDGERRIPDSGLMERKLTKTSVFGVNPLASLSLSLFLSLSFFLSFSLSLSCKTYCSSPPPLSSRFFHILETVTQRVAIQ